MVKIPVTKATFTVKGTGRKIVLSKTVTPSTKTTARAPSEKRTGLHYVYEKGKLVAIINKKTGEVVYGSVEKAPERIKRTVRAPSENEHPVSRMLEGNELKKGTVSNLMEGGVSKFLGTNILGTVVLTSMGYTPFTKYKHSKDRGIEPAGTVWVGGISPSSFVGRALRGQEAQIRRSFLNLEQRSRAEHTLARPTLAREGVQAVLKEGGYDWTPAPISSGEIRSELSFERGRQWYVDVMKGLAPVEGDVLGNIGKEIASFGVGVSPIGWAGMGQTIAHKGVGKGVSHMGAEMIEGFMEAPLESKVTTIGLSAFALGGGLGVIGGRIGGKVAPRISGISRRMGIKPKTKSFTDIKYLSIAKELEDISKGRTQFETLAISRTKIGKIQADIGAMFKSEPEPMKPRAITTKFSPLKSPMEEFLPPIERFTAIEKTARGYKAVPKGKIKFPETAVKITEPEFFFRKIIKPRKYKGFLGREPIVTVEKASGRFGGKGISTEIFKFPKTKETVSMFREKGFVEPYLEAKFIPKKSYDPYGMSKITARYKVIDKEISKSFGISRMKRVGEYGFEDFGGFTEKGEFFKGMGITKLKPKAMLPDELRTQILTPRGKAPKMPSKALDYTPSESQFMKMEASMKQATTSARPFVSGLAKESIRTARQVETQIFGERVGRTMGSAMAIPKVPRGVAIQVEMQKPQVTPRGLIELPKVPTIESMERNFEQFHGIYPISVSGAKQIPLISTKAISRIIGITPIVTQPPARTPTTTTIPIQMPDIETLAPPKYPTPFIPHFTGIKPYTPLLPPLPYPFGSGGRRKRKKRRRRKQPKKYRPSLTAVVYGIRGKQPKFVTGLGIRPMRRIKKVKRKVKRKKKVKRRVRRKRVVRRKARPKRRKVKRRIKRRRR